MISDQRLDAGRHRRHRHHATSPSSRRSSQITSGNIDDLAQPNTILLFEEQLEKLDVKVGDAITISAQTTRGTTNTIDCRVVAIAKDMGLLSKWNVFVPNETLRALYQLRSDATGAIHVMLRRQDLEQHRRHRRAACASRWPTPATA